MDNLVIQTALRNFLVKLATAVLVWVGGALLSHGFATEDQVRQVIDPLAQIVVGGAMTAIGVVVIWVRAHVKRSKEQNLLVANPADVTIKGA